MPVRRIVHGDHTHAKVYTAEIDLKTHQQIQDVASLPFIHKHIAVMPDTHAGYGVPIGAVVPTVNAVIPGAVGFDIGCGMTAARLSAKAGVIHDSLDEIFNQIEKAVPRGTESYRYNKKSGCISHTKGCWDTVSYIHRKTWYDTLATDFKNIIFKYPNIESTNVVKQLGTLGGGNHFIELCSDEQGDVWIVLHSGSRNQGKVIGEFFMRRAQEECEKWFIELPDKQLAFFPKDTEFYNDYLIAMFWAQRYAATNRKLMLSNIKDRLCAVLEPKHVLFTDMIDCHHNYAEMENHFDTNVLVTRKGAVRAREGDRAIIPGAMGRQTYIVKGKGDLASFCSCSHGAGRVLSRKKAKEQFSVEQVTEQMGSVKCRIDNGVLDEAPGAYKDLDEVMDNQSDLVDIEHILTPMLNIKGRG